MVAETTLFSQQPCITLNDELGVITDFQCSNLTSVMTCDNLRGSETSSFLLLSGPMHALCPVQVVMLHVSLHVYHFTRMYVLLPAV